MTETASSASQAVFTQGPTMRHVVVMTLTSAVGLIAIFFVDAVSLFYISLLNDPAQTAAVGRASYLLGFVIGISVGTMIGSSVMISRAIGAGRSEAARSYAASSIIGIFAFNALVGALLLAATDPLMALLDAEGEALNHAQTYLRIILPATPFLGIGMICMGILRAVGDARRAMFITLAGGITTALLDPLFIFVFGKEVTGAAIVSAGVRVLFALLGLYYVIGIHKLVQWPTFTRFVTDMRDVFSLAVPAVLTNLAAPVGAFLIAEKIAEFGDMALSGQAVVDRLIPIFFGTIFALSGAVGPIIGQNFGARRMDRVRSALRDAILFEVAYVSLAWLALFVFRNSLIAAYSATGDMALVIDLFCTIVAASFLFNGLLFVTNATFNNLGRPLWATFFNWSRQTVGVVPFIHFGAAWGGIPGISWGIVAGSIPFALMAAVAAFWLIGQMERATPRAPDPETVPAK